MRRDVRKLNELHDSNSKNAARGIKHKHIENVFQGGRKMGNI